MCHFCRFCLSASPAGSWSRCTSLHHNYRETLTPCNFLLWRRSRSSSQKNPTSWSFLWLPINTELYTQLFISQITFPAHVKRGLAFTPAFIHHSHHMFTPAQTAANIFMKLIWQVRIESRIESKLPLSLPLERPKSDDHRGMWGPLALSSIVFFFFFALSFFLPNNVCSVTD